MNGKIIAIIVLILAGYAIYLQSQGKLLAVIDALFTTKVGTVGASTTGVVPSTTASSSSIGLLDPSGQAVVPLAPIGTSQTSVFQGTGTGYLPPLNFGSGSPPTGSTVPPLSVVTAGY